jgi:hypothetical protein
LGYLSPFAAGLFQNFTTGFFMALGIFAHAIAYFQMCVTTREQQKTLNIAAIQNLRGEGLSSAESLRTQDPAKTPREGTCYTILSPLKPFQKQPLYLFIGFSIFG